MISARGIFLFVLLAPCTFSLSSCNPLKTVQSAPEDYDSYWTSHFTLPTRGPFVWTIEPVSPSGQSGRTKGTDAVLLAILFLPVILGLAIVFCVCLVNKLKTVAANSSPTTVHTPPPRTTRTSQQPSERPQLIINTSGITRQSLLEPSTSRNSVPSSANSAGDIPPNYSEVVIRDLTAGNLMFPEVSVKSIETPPPKYDDGSFPRF